MKGVITAKPKGLQGKRAGGCPFSCRPRVLHYQRFKNKGLQAAGAIVIALKVIGHKHRPRGFA